MGVRGTGKEGEESTKFEKAGVGNVGGEGGGLHNIGTSLLCQL